MSEIRFTRETARELAQLASDLPQCHTTCSTGYVSVNNNVSVDVYKQEDDGKVYYAVHIILYNENDDEPEEVDTEYKYTETDSVDELTDLLLEISTWGQESSNDSDEEYEEIVDETIKEMYPDWRDIEPGNWSQHGRVVEPMGYGDDSIEIGLYREPDDGGEYANTLTLQMFDGDAVILCKQVSRWEKKSATL